MTTNTTDIIRRMERGEFEAAPLSSAERGELSTSPASPLACIRGHGISKFSAIDYRAILSGAGLRHVPHLIQEAVLGQWEPRDLVAAVNEWTKQRGLNRNRSVAQ